MPTLKGIRDDDGMCRKWCRLSHNSEGNCQLPRGHKEPCGPKRVALPDPMLRAWDVLDEFLEELEVLSYDQRCEVFRGLREKYCMYCSSKQPASVFGCQCMNDE